MLLEADTAALLCEDDEIRSTVASHPVAANDSRPIAERGWASRNPSQALLFLYVMPHDGTVAEELMAL
jgi:hypothetical protein